MREVGAIAELWRYPVKSMLGQRVLAAQVDELGVPGDRRLALIDAETGRIASAKMPRLWRGLLKCAAAFEEGSAVRIAMPGAKPLWNTDADADERLSAYIGRPVHLADTAPEGATLDRSIPDLVLSEGVEANVDAALVRIGSGSPPGTFVDFAPLHLITSSTLDRIAALGERGAAEAQRYRPNLVIRSTGDGFIENDWLGRELRIGPDLRIEIVARTPRCAVPTLEHGSLERDPQALRVLAEHNRVAPLADVAPEPCAGAYARVMAPGRIEPGDKVLVSAD
ncbi:MAG TPA: MOSC N-terminal beta barrel domain-containing protein [Actinospica sp.]|nr:MOSC N-terminal beta barrel domain-containing protein [Actinospica sp.]